MVGRDTQYLTIDTFLGVVINLFSEISANRYLTRGDENMLSVTTTANILVAR